MDVCFFYLLSVLCSACIVCDDDATSELRVKTVRYFKGIQETQENLLRRPMEGYSGHAIRTASKSPTNR